MQRLLETAQSPDRGRSYLVASSPNPEATSRYLNSFEELHPETAARLLSSSTGLQCLVAVFSNSRFLSEEVLQHPNWLEDIAGSPDLYRVLPSEEMARQLVSMLPPDEEAAPPVLLAQFRRRQLLRILIRDVLGLAALSEITEEISNVADSILDITYRRIRAALVKRFGTPKYTAADGSERECGFSVIGLGKLGARELNYSSDIDLMFVYSGQGHTDGKQQITNKEFFKKVANTYTELLSTYTAEGLCYRVDLRLRPDGRLGEVCISLDGAKNYYHTRARDWELQMLIKARVAAGDVETGRELLETVEPRIYASTLDFSAVEAVSVTRERISEKLTLRRSSADSGMDIKLARGGIRDIEFLVQCLQRLHGGREPWVRHGGTLLALLRLNHKNLISSAEYSRLATAYEFLRHLEHRLQFLEDRQTHTLPTRRDELEILARKMPITELGRQPSAEKLLHQLNSHLEEVQQTYDRVIHSQQPLYYSLPVQQRSPRIEHAEPEVFQEPASSNLIRFLDQQAPGLAKAVAVAPLFRGRKSFEAFLEKVLAEPDLLKTLNDNRKLAGDALDIFEHSPFFADELIRRPKLVLELEDSRIVEPLPSGDLSNEIGDVTQLRRFFRRQMLRIQAESICGPGGIFHTLGRTSDLADTVVCTAYNLARKQVLETRPPETPSYEPREQMMVIALGRLGMREFDLGSDADLNFVLPDEDVHEMRFWTRVAERLIDILTSYTGEGVIFAVDTRLRPNGREGTLVQTINGYKDYLAKSAEAWEGITYMKSRAVAGDVEKSTQFLHELQEVDWRRYGQSGRSRGDLRAMRARLEREQGASNPLKAGPGGYYDIDFSLMYLRLKSAGIFYTVLNTPERIDIIEKMGHLDREDAAFLQDAATLYRAVDHGLRVYSGHAEGRLPQSPTHLEAITNLVKRWTPEHLHDQPLPEELMQIQIQTRDFFKRLFG